jgi:hypothetical protein
VTHDSRCDNKNVPPTPAQQARAVRIAARITATLTSTGLILPGTLTERMTRCGTPGCRCHADPPRLHGPCHQWTRKTSGKTTTRILTDAQLADYQPWFDTCRQLRALITELEELSLAITEADPRWNRKPPATQTETQPPHRVGSTRLTCGQPLQQPT